MKIKIDWLAIQLLLCYTNIDEFVGESSRTRLWEWSPDGRGQPSEHEGDWWIGGYEKYQGKQGQNPGDIQGMLPQEL